MTRKVRIMDPDGTVRQYLDGGEVDLDAQVVRNSDGERITEADVAAMVEAIETRPRGRPSLSGRGTSAVVRARVPDDLRAALAERARLEERSESEVVREALEAYLARS